MVVQHNLSAMNTNRQMGMVTSALQKSTEKLSSAALLILYPDDNFSVEMSIRLLYIV